MREPRTSSILHLAPDHDSRLAEVLQSATSMPVTQVRDRVRMRAQSRLRDSAKRQLGMEDGDIVVNPVDRPRAAACRRWTSSSALSPTTHEAKAVAVMLSGTGSERFERDQADQGARRAHHRPGSRRKPSTATCRSTRCSAASITCCRSPRFPARSWNTTSADRRAAATSAAGRSSTRSATALHEVLTLLRVRTGHDFANYKPATVMRRIERRMAVHKCATIADYARFMRTTPQEAGLLMKELLDQRHEFLSRSRRLRDARSTGDSAAVPGQVEPPITCGSGSPAVRPARRRTRWRCCSPNARRTCRPRRRSRCSRAISTRRRSRSRAKACTATPKSPTSRWIGCAVFPAGARRPSHPPRPARARPVRASQRHSRSAVLPPRFDRLPQPVDLSEPVDAGAGDRDVPFRAADRGLPVPRRIRKRGGRRPTCSCRSTRTRIFSNRAP